MKKIIVIKIGSSVIITRRGRIDEFRLSHIAQQIKNLYEKRYGIVLVVSGAVACGSAVTDTGNKQVKAGIGQVILISALERIFNMKKLRIAQVLLTRKNVDRNLTGILHFYTDNNIIPIINENDVVDLNSFGGNDILSAEISLLINADKLVILSTAQGSIYGVGGGKTKSEALRILHRKKINADVLDGTIKNVLLEALI